MIKTRKLYIRVSCTVKLLWGHAVVLSLVHGMINNLLETYRRKGQTIEFPTNKL